MNFFLEIAALCAVHSGGQTSSEDVLKLQRECHRTLILCVDNRITKKISHSESHALYRCLLNPKDAQ